MLQYAPLSLLLGTALQVCLSSAKQRSRIASPILQATFSLMKPEVLLTFFCEGMLVVHVQLGHKDPQVISCKAAFQSVVSQPALMWRDFPPQVQNLAVLFTELHEIPVCSFFQPCWVNYLNGSTTLTCQPLLPVLRYSKLSKPVLSHVIQLINEDVKQRAQLTPWVKTYKLAFSGSRLLLVTSKFK